MTPTTVSPMNDVREGRRTLEILRLWAKSRLRALIAITLPPALFFTMRPEPFGQVPNPLDPVFYTGFSINFQNLLKILPDRYYFIARWSAYMPQRLMCSIFGASLGRLMWRWMLASLVLTVLFRLGKRQGWRIRQDLVIGVVVLTMPAFVRAFFTDYVEYLVAALGIVLAAIVLAEFSSVDPVPSANEAPMHDDPRSLWSHLRLPSLIGIVSGLMLVANPVAVVSIGIVVVAYIVHLLRAVRSSSVTRPMATLRLATIGVTAASVGGAGWLLFHWAYDQPNLFGSTLDMISRIGQDPLKSPKLEWLGRYTWLYATPILVVSYLAIWYRPRQRSRSLNAVEWTAIAIASAQYLAQWVDQFLRNGTGLEISYYFVYSLPSFVLVAVLFVARTTRTLSRIACISAAGLWALVIWISPGGVHLPPGLTFALLAVAVTGAAFVFATRHPIPSAACVGVLVLATQLIPPTYDPSAYHLYNTSPRYDELFRRKPDRGDKTLSEAIWLVEQLDPVQGHVDASFIPIGGWLSDTNFVAGIYGPQPSGRLMYLTPELAAAPQTVHEISNGSRPLVVVLGPPDLVDTAVGHLRSQFLEMYQSAEGTHRGGFGYKFVALRVPHATRLPAAWNGADLRIQNGTQIRTAVNGPAGNSGIITYGPYLPLPKGRYIAQLTYVASRPISQSVGNVDAFFSGVGIVADEPLPGTAGKPKSIELPFSSPSDGARVEIRPASNGSSDLSIRMLTIRAAG